MEPCSVPELLDIFTNIVCARKPYCYICLRTNDERRLVPPKCFNSFMNAINVKIISNRSSICHICERQSYNALKFFRAATFASSLSLILQELIQRGIVNNKVMLEANYFRRVLNKCALSKNLTPKTIYDELKIVRNNSELSETDTLVMDNSQVYEAAPVPTVVAITTGQANVNNEQAIQQAIIQCSVSMDTPAILPDRQVTAAEILQSNFRMLKPPETYVILDDDDDTLRAINLNNQPNNVATQPVAEQPNLNINTDLVVTTEPPSIMTFQELLQQPKQKQTNCLLHPIFLAPNNSLSIPSLSATISNGFLRFEDPTKTSFTTQPLGVNTDIIKQNLLLNKEVFLQSSNTGTAANNLTDDRCQNETSNNAESEREKREIDVSEVIMGTWPKKRGRKSENSVKDVQISDISSDMDNPNHHNAPRGKTGQAKTDWEDKIPMDVISFVDAVDPNAHKMLKAYTPTPHASDMVQLGDVRSLANEPKCDEIIDLC